MYTKVIEGDSPIILTVPHDGDLRIEGAAIRPNGKLRDLGTLPLARACREGLLEKGMHPTLIWFELHREHVDVNRSRKGNPFADGFETEFEAFHVTLDDHIARVLARNGRAMLVDIHGCFIPGEEWDIVVGSRSHKTCPAGRDLRLVEGLANKYRIVCSPDPVGRMDGRYNGGWIVGRTAKKFGTQGLDSLQLEFNRHLRQYSRTHALAQHIAEAIMGSLA